jgi:glutaredoxin
VALIGHFFFIEVMKLELFYYEQCPYCQLVLRKLKSLNIKDKVILKNTKEVDDYYNYHRKKTGRSTVPCLYIDDQPMFESADICHWLEINLNKIKEA